MKSQTSSVAKDTTTASVQPAYDTDAIISALLSDQIATVPTETVEGYAVCLNSKSAVHSLMLLKERGFQSGKVFTLVPTSPDDISLYCQTPSAAAPLIAEHIPGELTLLLPKNPAFHHFYFDHFDKIGIRIPAHPLFPKLLSLTGPLLLTSANQKGDAPRSLTGHLPSTIIDFSLDAPKIIRQGNLIISLDQYR